MTYLLTAAAGAIGAAAAAGPAGWIVLAVVGGVLATAATIAAVKEIKENKDEIKNKKEILDNLDKELEEINREFAIYDNATAATEKLDQGERTYLNDLANSNADAVAKQQFAYENATSATEKLDQGERTYLNDLANSNADSYAINNQINTPAEEKPKEEAPGNNIVTEVPKTETEGETEENQNKDNQPVVGGDVSDLLDGTGENEETKIENAMSYQDFVSWWEEQQQKAWDREDSIRKEIQDREDSAYQRAVADMRKAGININLLGVNPAESGGGITQATIPDMSVLTSEMKVSAEKLQQLIDQEFEGDQATKDRILDAFTSLLSSVGMFLTFKKFK